MKKIIIACEGANFSEGAFEFAKRLNEMERILLIGVFLPQATFADMWSVGAGAGVPLYAPLDELNEAELTQQSVDKFSKLCQDNYIDYRVHSNLSNFVLPELKKETSFADLLILGGETFYQKVYDATPNQYLEDALQHVNCPVVIVPEQFGFPEGIVLAYDGSDDSVFAIKQFAYLFPELCDMPVLLVYASKEEENDFPDKIRIEELAARHFSNLGLLKLDINPRKYFSTWISERKYSLLVSGSFGRSQLSLVFKKSFVNDVLANHQVPVFIAHR